MAASCAPKVLDPRIQRLDGLALARHGAHRLPRLGRVEIVQQFDDVAREGVRAAGQVTAQGLGGQAVRARRAPKAQVDAPGKQGGQRPELLGDDQRRVVGQHDAAGADSDRRGSGADERQGHGRRRAGDAGHVVVLGHPEAMIAEPLGVPRQVQAVAQGLPGVAAFGDGREIEN